jgi:hypothetical protein
MTKFFIVTRHDVFPDSAVDIAIPFTVRTPASLLTFNASKSGAPNIDLDVQVAPLLTITSGLSVVRDVGREGTLTVRNATPLLD